jgi:hypothetical protein
MVIRQLQTLLTVACAALVFSACHECAFRLLQQSKFSSTPGNLLPCCGGYSVADIDVPSLENGKVDIANDITAGGDSPVDLWLTDVSCVQLFTGTYPGSPPSCPVHLGPVAPDQVSDKVPLRAGRYRIVAQAYTSNAKQGAYVADVGFWGNDCRYSSVSPSPQ